MQDRNETTRPGDQRTDALLERSLADHANTIVTYAEGGVGLTLGVAATKQVLKTAGDYIDSKKAPPSQVIVPGKEND